MNKQDVLDVLNNLEVVEEGGGLEPYILVANSKLNRDKLKAAGVTVDQVDRYGDEDTFCILAFAFNEGFADDFIDGKLVTWGPIDDDLRIRVMAGEGTARDAARLLYELEPSLSVRKR